MNGRLITHSRTERERERKIQVRVRFLVGGGVARAFEKYSVQKEGWTEGIPRDWSVHGAHDAEGVFDKYFPPRRRVSRDIYSGHLGPNAIYFHPAAEEKGKE